MTDSTTISPLTISRLTVSRMNGLGNHFLIVDARADDISLSGAQIAALSADDHPQTKGCDQFLIIRPPKPHTPEADIFMQIFNADGQEVEACGNGTRAIARYLSEETGKSDISIDTLAGCLYAKVDGEMVSVNMGAAKFAWQDIPLATETDTEAVSLHPQLPPAYCVNIGNPHAVIFIDGNPQAYAQDYGAALEYHKLFPQQANINFVRIDGDGNLTIATWERGVGLTKACGTGACASFAAYQQKQNHIFETELTVHLPGGDLFLHEQAGEIFMRGAAVFEFTVEVAL